MATVEFIDGRIVEGVALTGVEHVGDEGSRRATAHLDGKTYDVFNSIVDGFDPVWHEQMTMETWRMLKGTSRQFVDGSVDETGKGSK